MASVIQKSLGELRPSKLQWSEKLRPRGERKVVKKGTPLLVGGIGIVDREHHAVDAERQQRRNEWRLGEHAAGCEPDLVENGSADRSLQVLDLESEHIIGTGQHHWQHFAHVPYDELESRMPIERAGEH